MRLFSIFVITAALAGTARAEEEPGRYRTALSAVGGLSVGSTGGFAIGGRSFEIGRHGDGAGAAVGGSIARDITSRITLEASGIYLDRSASAWSADAGVRLNLQPSARSVVPYFAASGGIYSESGRASNELLARAFGVGQRIGVPGPGRGGSTPVRAGIPRGAVAMRFDELLTDGVDTGRRNDALLSMGGGVVFAAGQHVFVRPDVRAQMVFSGDTRVFGLFTLSFGYRF